MTGCTCVWTIKWIASRLRHAMCSVFHTKAARNVTGMVWDVVHNPHCKKTRQETWFRLIGLIAANCLVHLRLVRLRQTLHGYPRFANQEPRGVLVCKQLARRHLSGRAYMVGWPLQTLDTFAQWWEVASSLNSNTSIWGSSCFLICGFG